MSTEIVWRPTEAQVAESNLMRFMCAEGIAGYQALLARAEAEPEWWWRTVTSWIDFYQPYQQVSDLERGVEFARWCRGGTTNIVLNALDRHRGTTLRDAPALIHEAEDGTVRDWSYAELEREVCRLAGGLRALGISQDEVVAIYLPNVPEAVFGLLDGEKRMSQSAAVKVGVPRDRLSPAARSRRPRDKVRLHGDTNIRSRYVCLCIPGGVFR